MMNATPPSILDPAVEARNALDHLLVYFIAGSTVANHIRAAAIGSGPAIRLLAMLGLRYCEQGDALAVAVDLPADDVFLFTRWRGSHDRALSYIPGTKRKRVWIGGEHIQAVLVPRAECFPQVNAKAPQADAA